MPRTLSWRAISSNPPAQVIHADSASDHAVAAKRTRWSQSGGGEGRPRASGAKYTVRAGDACVRERTPGNTSGGSDRANQRNAAC